MDERIYPLTFTPALRDYIWGGRRLAELYGRELPPGKIAESWEISGHPAAPTAADAGYWAGQPLPAILQALGDALVGKRASWALRRQKFPLLVKLLDCHENLSVQVHPDDTYAQAHEGGELGKTEMWYVLHADPGSQIILGLQPGVTRDQFRQALDAGQQELDGLLHRIPVAAGQAVAVPAGTIHALLGGVVVTEIQQNSDTTYRVWDWGRVDKDGKPRPLHVDKALDVISWGAAGYGVSVPQVQSSVGGVTQSQLVRNQYFVVEEVILDAGASYLGTCDGATMEIWGCVAGQATVISADDHRVELPSIRYALIPAAMGDFEIAAHGPCTCLRVYLPRT
ncbi:MAG TPA: type I phosphomannose isomerase catalytic subunit [Anaerolineae bacterium]